MADPNPIIDLTGSSPEPGSGSEWGADESEYLLSSALSQANTIKSALQRISEGSDKSLTGSGSQASSEAQFERGPHEAEHLRSLAQPQGNIPEADPRNPFEEIDKCMAELGYRNLDSGHQESPETQLDWASSEIEYLLSLAQPQGNIPEADPQNPFEEIDKCMTELGYRNLGSGHQESPETQLDWASSEIEYLLSLAQPQGNIPKADPQHPSEGNDKGSAHNRPSTPKPPSNHSWPAESEVSISPATLRREEAAAAFRNDFDVFLDNEYLCSPLNDLFQDINTPDTGRVYENYRIPGGDTPDPAQALQPTSFDAVIDQASWDLVHGWDSVYGTNQPSFERLSDAELGISPSVLQNIWDCHFNLDSPTSTAPPILRIEDPLSTSRSYSVVAHPPSPPRLTGAQRSQSADPPARSVARTASESPFDIRGQQSSHGPGIAASGATNLSQRAPQGDDGSAEPEASSSSGSSASPPPKATKSQRTRASNALARAEASTGPVSSARRSRLIGFRRSQSTDAPARAEAITASDPLLSRLANRPRLTRSQVSLPNQARARATTGGPLGSDPVSIRSLMSQSGDSLARAAAEATTPSETSATRPITIRFRRSQANDGPARAEATTASDPLAIHSRSIGSRISRSNDSSARARATTGSTLWASRPSLSSSRRSRLISLLAENEAIMTSSPSASRPRSSGSQRPRLCDLLTAEIENQAILASSPSASPPRSTESGISRSNDSSHRARATTGSGPSASHSRSIKSRLSQLDNLLAETNAVVSRLLASSSRSNESRTSQADNGLARPQAITAAARPVSSRWSTSRGLQSDDGPVRPEVITISSPEAAPAAEVSGSSGNDDSNSPKVATPPEEVNTSASDASSGISQYEFYTENMNETAPFKCPVPRCKYKGTFKKKASLRTHIREQHTRRGPKFQCPVEGCRATRIRKADMTRHLKKDHPEPDPGVPVRTVRPPKRRILTLRPPARRALTLRPPAHPPTLNPPVDDSPPPRSARGRQNSKKK
ncbi:hypothetical protein BO70DRAFT_349728 [Aspergillus heteromorphus CBS 117.55]|uniref:C2H2-type domain-containing protein n=1 Tax=Aspergillus heteromorphus CBS 117.55 TaxID=1448321 RepID=A0A317X3Y0_9EURO|nr:uncharacterized protein BO70DRAFT_349728 [Aspergillus heteromorphus CBS 117.55]PWY91260.1 hypothetical protein BO70DRAFT_349728 [Aspergillus heteromorphus CBS 117.55]